MTPKEITMYMQRQQNFLHKFQLGNNLVKQMKKEKAY